MSKIYEIAKLFELLKITCDENALAHSLICFDDLHTQNFNYFDVASKNSEFVVSTVDSPGLEMLLLKDFWSFLQKFLIK